MPRPGFGVASGVPPKPRRQKSTGVSRPQQPPAASLLRRQEREDRAGVRYRRALRGFRARKSDRGRLVFLAAKDGKRVGKGYRGKVYPVYVTRIGTKKPYVEKARGTKIPVAVGIRSIDPAKFGTKGGRKAAERELYARTSRLVEPLTIRSKARRGIDWDKRVVGPAMDVMARFARANTGGFNAVLEWTALVAVSDGEGGQEYRTYTGAVDWKLSMQQVAMLRKGMLPPQWLVPIIQSKLYADVAQKIGESEFVTMGSALFVEMLPANEGLPRDQWRDARGRKWDKWDCRDVRLAAFSIEPRLVVIDGRK